MTSKALYYGLKALKVKVYLEYLSTWNGQPRNVIMIVFDDSIADPVINKMYIAYDILCYI